jgi:formamidase
VSAQSSDTAAGPARAQASQPAHRIELDLARQLVSVPELGGHNRWHPDLTPLARIEAGELIDADMRNGLDLPVTESTTSSDFAAMDLALGHPLTGPFFVEGAEPGDYLEIEIHAVTTVGLGFTAIIPGVGLLSAEFDEPFLVKWHIEDGVASSPDIPGVVIPGRPFLGVVGVAPSRQRLQEISEREAEVVNRGGTALAPTPVGSVPSGGSAAAEGLRTIPPRETGGNMDIRHHGAGSRVTLPVDVPGALLSIGDVHFAQGDGESCGVAIEADGRATISCRVKKAADSTWRPRNPFYEFVGVDTREESYIATTGIPVTSDGRNADLDVYCAAQQALRELVDYLEEVRGYTRAQAYVVVSVAADLQISSIVNVPNAVVSAVLPTSIFV